MTGNNGSVELKSGAQEGQGCLGLTQCPHVWDSLTFHSLGSRQSGMSREAQSSPLPALEVSTYNTLKGCFNTSWEGGLPNSQWQVRTLPAPRGWGQWIR